MNISNLEKQLVKYAYNCEDPEVNFSLALEYANLNQVASALSHFLRCAERTDDKLLQYECMLLAGLGIKKQGSRLYTEKSFFQNAISILPLRPEAYLYMAETLSKINHNHDAYTMICIGDACSALSHSNLRTKVPYFGPMEFKFKKIMYGKKVGINVFADDLAFLNDVDIKFA
jgi:hypothetical protein